MVHPTTFLSKDIILKSEMIRGTDKLQRVLVARAGIDVVHQSFPPRPSVQQQAPAVIDCGGTIDDSVPKTVAPDVQPQETGGGSAVRTLATVARQSKPLSRKKKAAMGGRGGIVNMGGFGIVPDRARARLKAVLALNGALSAGSAAYTFNAHLTDPFEAFGAGQPNGFDQWMTLYYNYMVRGCRCKYTLCAQSSADSKALILALAPNDPAGAFTAIANCAGSPGAVSGIQGGAGAPALMLQTEFIDVSKILGLTVEEMRAQPACWGQSAVAPTRYLEFSAALANATGAGTTSYTALVELDFDAEFFERVPLDAS